jgi:hypothetical protein
LLQETKQPVTLVDFDLVEPFYTLRPIKEELEQKGLKVIAWNTKETIGLGEAGSLIKPEMRWALRRKGNVIFDVGYGIEGAKKLRLVEGALEGSEMNVYVVINIARPITGELQDIVEYVRTLGPVDGIINNSHLGDDTDIEIIQEGAKIVTDAAKVLKIPVMWTSAEKKFSSILGKKDAKGNPVIYIERHMNRTFW